MWADTRTGPRRGARMLRTAQRADGGRRDRPRSALTAAWLAHLLLALLLPRSSGALYHTASETLHWFAHKAAQAPDRIRCAPSRA